MQALDEMLPDIDDVENMMMDNTRFDLPESQKYLDRKMDEVIKNKAGFTLSQITELIKSRLSFFNIFMLYEDIEMSKVKINAEMNLQNEKLEFLFRTLSKN